jgi:putative transposase
MQRKGSTRLRDFDYTGTYIYFITCLTFKKKPYFSDGLAVDCVLSILDKVSIRYEFKVLLYCFMPDHLHLLIEGAEKSSLPDYIHRFKQMSSYTFKKKSSQRLWQRSYYDHVLRKEQSLRDIARYILNNPVRKGIVDEYTKYPYSGSFILDIHKSGRI